MKLIDNYINLLEKTDYMTFLPSFIVNKDLNLVQNFKYFNSKFYFLFYKHLYHLIKRRLTSLNLWKNEKTYMIDFLDLYYYYSLKAILKYNNQLYKNKYKFTTYFIFWILKIVFEYKKRLQKYNKLLNYNNQFIK